MPIKKTKIDILSEDYVVIGKFTDNLRMDAKEAQKIYNQIEKDFEKNLKKHEVKLPNNNTNDYFQLVFLYKHMREFIHKDVVSEFVKTMNTKAGSDCQVRQLALKGWYILVKNDKIPGTALRNPSGYHALWSVDEAKPSYLLSKRKRKSRLDAKTFEELKVIYNHKCATCGAEEGKLHPRETDKIVVLHQGHMNPKLELTIQNSIPQCESCNGIYKDYFIFDDNGRIKAINNPQFVLKSQQDVQEEILLILKEQFNLKEDANLECIIKESNDFILHKI
jgi:hypothetical protein